MNLESQPIKSNPDVSEKMLLNDVKCQGYSFHRVWVIKGKPTGMVKLLPTQQYPPRLGLKCYQDFSEAE